MNIDDTFWSYNLIESDQMSLIIYHELLSNNTNKIDISNVVARVPTFPWIFLMKQIFKYIPS